MTSPLLRVEDLSVRFQVAGRGFMAKKQSLRAVDGVSFDIRPGETLGIVGESGCGKSTLTRAILNLVSPSGGTVHWGDRDLTTLNKKSMNALRRHIQIVFQSPLASLNPRMTIGEIIAEPLDVFEPHLSKEERSTRARNMMETVGLRPDMAGRYPNEFSGGQCQRASIARAMIANPQLLICDEAVSALDVSIKAQIINLLKKLQKETGIAIIFVSHDLAIVRQISHRVLVMYLGKVMELAPANTLFADPQHPYTKALLEAVPRPDPAYERNKVATVLKGDIPSPLSPPSGCVFRTRCPVAKPNCIRSVPELTGQDGIHKVACHYV